MSDDENLTSELSVSYEEFKRNSMVKHLAERGHLTVEKLSKLLDNPEYGKTLATISLQMIFDAREQPATAAPAAKKASKAPAAKKTAAPTAKKAAKKATKAPPAKKAAKAPAPKKAAKKAPAAAKGGKKPGAPKADKGKPKPRLDYENGCKEVLAALKAADGPVGRGDIEKATGFQGVQVRAFCKKLASEGKIQVTGNGGRSTRYELK